jgi:hypothetical protein
MSKMYLWVLTLATKSEPTLIGQLAFSLQMISILDVASSSIALWINQLPVSTAKCPHGSLMCFATFFVKIHKNANKSIITQRFRSIIDICSETISTLTKTNSSKSASCLGRVFNFKSGRLALWEHK